jgi:hypothetical protein
MLIDVAIVISDFMATQVGTFLLAEARGKYQKSNPSLLFQRINRRWPSIEA